MPSTLELSKRESRQHLSADDPARSHYQPKVLIRRANPYPNVIGGIYAAHTNGQFRGKGDSAVVSELEQVAERLERSGVPGAFVPESARVVVRLPSDRNIPIVPPVNRAWKATSPLSLSLGIDVKKS